MGEKREAQLTREQIEEYRLMMTLGSEEQRRADYFHQRRRRLEDEFAKLLGFDDRIDAKRQAFALQIYLSDRMVRAHNRHTTPTVRLGDYSKDSRLVLTNASDCMIYIGNSEDSRPRDGRTHAIAPGGSLQFPYPRQPLFMAADSKHPLRVDTLRIDDTRHITIGGPEEQHE